MAEKNNRVDIEIQTDLSSPTTPMQYLRILLSGFAMGASDIVPGVSGGTMAFILGIYETLINGIKSFNITALQMSLAFFTADDEEKPSLMEIVDHLHLRFLLPLGVGLVIAVILLSSLLEGLITEQPTYIFAFFAGLIVASVVAIGYKVKWGAIPVIALIIGTGIAYFVTNPEFGTLGESFGHGPLVLFLSGAVAICAMILPGISGSFILLVLGQYEFVLGAVKERDIISLIYVALGAGLGILAFSRVLSWLLSKYEHPTIALLVGFMVGSMRLIYYRATHFVDEETEIATQLNLESNQILIAFGLAVVGFIFVSVLDHMQSRSNPFLAIFDRGATAIPATGD